MAEPARNADPTRSSDMVMVGCKLPNGLILELVDPGTAVNADGKPIQHMQPRPAGKRHVLKGANSLREDKRAAQGTFPVAFTPVPRSFWNEWMKRNGELEFVVKGFVFAQGSAADAQAQAKDVEDERTGLEALAHEKDPRVLQIGRLSGANVESDSDSLARAMQTPA